MCSVMVPLGPWNHYQEQLQAHSKLRFSNPTLAKELKGKAEQHLELLMKLAESQQENHIQGAGSNTSQLQQLLQELEVQLDLEKQVMLTASIGVIDPMHTADAASNAAIGRADGTGSQVSSTGSSGSEAGLQQQLQQSQQEVSNLRGRLLEAEARALILQQQLDDADARLQSVSEELHEHRELQMAYDRQCQDLYRLRMQLQLEQSQGSDAASLAAMANKQHKQVSGVVARHSQCLELCLDACFAQPQAKAVGAHNSAVPSCVCAAYFRKPGQLLQSQGTHNQTHLCLARVWMVKSHLT